MKLLNKKSESADLQPVFRNRINMNKRTIFSILILFSIFLFFVYNSGTEYYEKSIEFSRKNFSGEITKIVETRGTKVYYKDYDIENYFYLGDYSGVELLVGDVLRKRGDEITVMRKGNNNELFEVGKGKSLKPEKSYFTYFTGI